MRPLNDPMVVVVEWGGGRGRKGSCGVVRAIEAEDWARLGKAHRLLNLVKNKVFIINNFVFF